jgi:hypothetical protein
MSSHITNESIRVRTAVWVMPQEVSDDVSVPHEGGIRNVGLLDVPDMNLEIH